LEPAIPGGGAGTGGKPGAGAKPAECAENDANFCDFDCCTAQEECTHAGNKKYVCSPKPDTVAKPGGGTGTGGKPDAGAKPGAGAKPDGGAKPGGGGTVPEGKPDTVANPGGGTGTEGKPAAGAQPGAGAQPDTGTKPDTGAKPDAGRGSSDRVAVIKEMKTVEIKTKMAPGKCQAQTEADKSANAKNVAVATGTSLELFDLGNSAAECLADARTRRRRRGAATKDNFAVTLAFFENVTAATVTSAIAAVNVRISSGNFSLSLAVNGTSVEVTITEVAAQGTKTVTTYEDAWGPKAKDTNTNQPNVTTTAEAPYNVPKAGAALARSSTLATLSLAAACLAATLLA